MIPKDKQAGLADSIASMADEYADRASPFYDKCGDGRWWQQDMKSYAEVLAIETERETGEKYHAREVRAEMNVIFEEHYGQCPDDFFNPAKRIGRKPKIPAANFIKPHWKRR